MLDPKEIDLLRRLLPVGRVLEFAESLDQIDIGSDELPAVIDSLQECGFVFCRTPKTIGIVKEPESLLPGMILARLQTENDWSGCLGLSRNLFHERSGPTSWSGRRSRRSRDCRMPDRGAGDTWPEMGLKPGRRPLVFDSPAYAVPGRAVAGTGPDGGCGRR